MLETYAVVYMQLIIIISVIIVITYCAWVCSVGRRKARERWKATVTCRISWWHGWFWREEWVGSGTSRWAGWTGDLCILPAPVLHPCPLLYVSHFSLSTFPSSYPIFLCHLSRLKSRIWHLYLFDDFKKCKFLAIQSQLQWNFRWSNWFFPSSTGCISSRTKNWVLAQEWKKDCSNKSRMSGVGWKKVEEEKVSNKERGLRQ